MVKVMTLGRVAFERACKQTWLCARSIVDWTRIGDRERAAWEDVAQAVSDHVVAMLPPPAFIPLEQPLAGKNPRPRQGGMVNVHTKPPTHYNVHPSGVECIEVTRHLPFNLGNVVKYIWRAGLKENESEIKDLEKSLDYLNDEINKRKLALGLAPSYHFETQLDARPPEHKNFRCIVKPIEFEPLRTDNRNPNARCKSPICATYDARTGGANAFVRMPYYYCLACLVRFGELNADGSHRHASGGNQ